MSLDLVKGEAFDLTKDTPGLKKFVLAGGWDAQVNPGEKDFDLDLFGMCLVNGKLESTEDIAYFNRKEVHGIKLSEDNRTGADDANAKKGSDGNPDDEFMTVDLATIPAKFDSVILGINIFEGTENNQRFSQIQNARVRVYNEADDSEILMYKLREDYKRSTAVVVGRIYRKGAEWEFEALGEGTDGSIADVAAKYQ